MYCVSPNWHLYLAIVFIKGHKWWKTFQDQFYYSCWFHKKLWFTCNNAIMLQKSGLCIHSQKSFTFLYFENVWRWITHFLYVHDYKIWLINERWKSIDNEMVIVCKRRRDRSPEIRSGKIWQCCETVINFVRISSADKL